MSGGDLVRMRTWTILERVMQRYTNPGIIIEAMGVYKMMKILLQNEIEVVEWIILWWSNKEWFRSNPSSELLFSITSTIHVED
jgi:hypothetical protein